MHWFILSLLGPILWTAVNFADKYLLSIKNNDGNVGALVIFSTLFSIFVLPIFFLLDKDIFKLGYTDTLFLILIGLMDAVAILMYMYALEQDDTSVVVPLFQTIPIFGLVFSFLLLNELPKNINIIGCLFLILGSILISIDLQHRNEIIKHRVFFLMLGSSFMFGLYQTLFKVIAVEDSFYIANFWQYVGLLISGILLFSFIKNYRESFLSILRNGGGLIISINGASEVFTIVGNVFTNMALLIAPVALVLAVSGIQPFFLFIFGILLSYILPKYFKENLSRVVLFQKIIASVIFLMGSYLINI